MEVIQMRKWMEKKSFQAVLIIVLLFIWGYNTYKIAGIGTEDKVDEDLLTVPIMDVDTLVASEVDRYSYDAGFRDPFVPILAKKVIHKPRISQPKPKREIKLPSLELTGIVEEMAMIQNKQRQIFFVSKGDTVEGARVQFVTSDSVVLIYESKKLTLKFNN